jgi:hypothetical protein
MTNDLQLSHPKTRNPGGDRKPRSQRLHRFCLELRSLDHVERIGLSQENVT